MSTCCHRPVKPLRTPWRPVRAGLFALASLLGTSATLAATTELVILQSNLSSRTQFLLQNLDHVAASPFDGVALNIPATWSGTLKTERLSYTSVFNDWLQPLVGRMPKLAGSYLRVNLRDSGDPFDNWAPVLDNWAVLARAAHATGMRGIYFDNEAYSEATMEYPGTVAYPGLGLAAYQERYRQRGAEVMGRLQAEWQGVEIVTLHGPYVSEPATPAAVRRDQVGASATDMRGYFFAGMLQDKGPLARVTDGGELYQYRNAADYELSTQWRRYGIAQVSGSTLVPASLAGSWASRLSLSFGVYDRQWLPNYPMTPALLEEALFQAFMHADSPVWLYADQNDYLVPGGVDAAWLGAINSARQRALVAQVPEPSVWVMMALGVCGVVGMAGRARRSGVMTSQRSSA
jgi:PEP-CTERM motif